MRFQVLGGLAVDDGGRPVELGGPKQRAVLAALLVELGRPVSAARLEHLVWGEHPPANPETSLQAYVSNLRRSLEPDRKPREPARLLVTQPAGYALLAPRHDVDAAQLEDLVATGVAALASGDAGAAVRALDDALALWRGPLLPDLAGEPWVDDHATWLEGLRQQALEARFDAGLALGQHVALLPRLERAVAEHPFRERLRSQQALALYRAGRQREALASLAAARSALVEEVGVEPGPELRRLEADILAQSPDLDAPALAPPRSGPPVAEAAPVDVVTPRADDRPFVGRERELRTLLSAASEAAAGRGRPVVLSGEPGIGKTRLVEELVLRLPEAVVAWGRCPETAASTAYWPCVQIGRQLEGAGALAGDLIAGLLPTAAPTELAEVPNADRLRLHSGVCDMLATADRLVVAVVDDLQWGDPASLRLIEYVAAELQRTRVLLVATVRPTGADAPTALIDCLGELARAPGALRIDLPGLAATDVEQWLSVRSAGAHRRDVAGLVHDRSGGNPFFVSEIIDLYDAEGRLDDPDAVRAGGPPAAVQDVIRRRVSRLPSDTQVLLGAAAVVGRAFDVDVLGEVTGTATSHVLDQLEPALHSGVLVESDLPARFQFSHALVAEALSAELNAIRRARLHAATAAAIAELRAGDLDSHAAELAHHALAGAAAGSAEDAHRWSVRAAQVAAAQRSYDGAAQHWARAVRALELARPGDARARFDARLQQGLAHLRFDELEAGYAALGEAIELAIGLDRPDLVADAAAAMNVDGLWQAGEVGTSSSDALQHLERALAVMSEEPSAARVLALATTTENAYWSWPVERLDAVSAEAVAMARTLDDPVVLGKALVKRNVSLWWSSSLEQREEAVGELLSLAQAGLLPRELEALAHFSAAGVTWERGDAALARSLGRQARTLAEEVGTPALRTQLDFFHGAMAAFQGHLAESEALFARGHELYLRTRRWNADAIWAGCMTSVWVDQDRLDEVRSHRVELVETQYGPWFKEAYALALARLGELDEATEVAAMGLPPLVDSWLYTGVVSAALQVRVAIGDLATAEELGRLLRPLAGRLSTTGSGPALGDVHGCLALVDRAAGRRDEALHHADASVALLDAGGAGGPLVDALLLRADLDPGRADADVAQAAAIVDRLDLPRGRRLLAASR